MNTGFRFSGSWWIDAEPAAVRDVVVDLEFYPQWWPQVLAVAALGGDDARVLCRSTLPYTLDLVLHAVCRDLPVLEVEVGGDLEGRIRWSLSAEVGHSGGTRLDLDQQVDVVGLLGAASSLLRPVLRWNHDRMMAGGIAGLRRRVGGARDVSR